jgi:ribonuclease P protein component
MRTFRKNERLCSRKIIDQLFQTGRSFKVYPFVVNWNEPAVKRPSPLQVMMAVSSRTIRSAPERNRIRRLMREAFRKNKEGLISTLEQQNRQCMVVLLFTGKDKLTFAEAERKIVLILHRLQKEYEKAAG